MLELKPLSEASPMAKRVAFYLRVSTGDGQQTIENQRRALDEIAERAGWQVIEVYADEISGTKGRERRPAFDRMLKAAVHRKFDMIAAWSVDRLGRSLQDLVAFLGELKAAGVDLFLHQRAARHLDAIGPGSLPIVGRFCRIRGSDDSRADTRRACAGSGAGKAARPAASYARGYRRSPALARRWCQRPKDGGVTPRRHQHGPADQNANL